MTGQDRTGQDRTGQDRTGQDRTGQDRTQATEQDRSGQDRTGQQGSWTGTAAAAGPSVPWLPGCNEAAGSLTACRMVPGCREPISALQWVGFRWLFRSSGHSHIRDAEPRVW